MAKPRATLAAMLVTLGIGLQAPSSSAEPSAREKTAAETLFQRATELVNRNQLAEGCAKFEASQTLDPALGTMLRLADCYDRSGKTASAWALFRESASLAETSNQPDRRQIASRRADDLEQRLSKLEVRVSTSERATLELRLNGVGIPEALWNTPLPVDPGLQLVEASARGRKPYSTECVVAKGPSLRVLEVPKLAPALPARKDARQAIIWRDEPRPKRGGTQRALGYVSGGFGVAGLGAGGYLGYLAYSANRASVDECRENDSSVCTPEGKRRRDEAQTFATASTIAFAAGGVLIATGFTLILTAPSNAPRASAQQSLRLHAGVLPRSAALRLEGEF